MELLHEKTVFNYCRTLHTTIEASSNLEIAENII